MQRPEFDLWPTTSVQLNGPDNQEFLVLEGKVVRGFQRGSTEIGCPTANLEMTEVNVSKTLDVVPGVYMGLCLLNNKWFKAACSVGWNPCYDNV